VEHPILDAGASHGRARDYAGGPAAHHEGHPLFALAASRRADLSINTDRLSRCPVDRATTRSAKMLPAMKTSGWSAPRPGNIHTDRSVESVRLVNEEDLMNLNVGHDSCLFKDVMQVELPDFQRMPYSEL